MDTRLSEQIQALIDAVEVAETQMTNLAWTMGRNNGDCGPEYRHIQDEIARILDELGYMRYLAELREAELVTNHMRNRSSLN